MKKISICINAIKVEIYHIQNYLFFSDKNMEKMDDNTFKEYYYLLFFSLFYS